MILVHEKIKELYGETPKTLEHQKKRYKQIITKHLNNFGNTKGVFFSTPGRVELSGNHTDHNSGKVLSAAINLDTIAFADKTENNLVTLYSEKYKKPFIVDLQNLEINKEETGSTSALIRGVAKSLANMGYNIGGFNATVTSNVMIGSGLSSSASIEILLGTIFNYFFNSSKISPLELAKAGQFAENIFFGKPCGLMDQLTIAFGGITKIDFKNPEFPVVKKIDFNFSETGYRMVVVNTGSNHEDLTDDYASIPSEMKAVAKALGKNVCRKINYKMVLANMQLLRSEIGDRAILRTLHFFEENNRIENLSNALINNDFNNFLKLITDSGNSSFKWLQNIYSPTNPKNQSISIALAVTEKMLGKEGAYRVHGGGFAGTILVFLPFKKVNEYKNTMEAVFGKNSVIELSIRECGPYVFMPSENI
jgi:galactokinase